ncbi:hypothetical protein EVAR_31493_1 [Eumeta japonica]|uniref:Uncharacterized protein n=1 Tax=Eumeta variegata TaxID=151549 RepID=A0A4C1WA77_EUMVA|nr:hypothetical protein EVAR_31493_1 [Eumeta japonica]
MRAIKSAHRVIRGSHAADAGRQCLESPPTYIRIFDRQMRARFAVESWAGTDFINFLFRQRDGAGAEWRWKQQRACKLR